jgi:DNA-binding NtrC family response regulator
LNRPGERPRAPHEERADTRGLVPVLVLHGTAAERDQVARVFHRDSPVRNGRFVRLDVSREEDRLRSALRERTTEGDRASETSPLHVAERGTLFLDGLSSMAADTQLLLLELLAAAGPNAWTGRVIAGDAGALTDAVTSGRFSSALYRLLDQVRVELEDRSSEP